MLAARTCLLAFVTAQDVPPPSAPDLDRSIELELSQGTPGGGPEAWTEHRVEFGGALHVWTDDDAGLDLSLRILGEDGRVLAEDRDSGGRPRPYAQLGVEPGAQLAFCVSGRMEDRGSFTLRLVASPESADSREAAARAREVLLEIQRTRDSGEIEAAREAVARLLAELLPFAESTCSDPIAESLWILGSQAYALGMLEETATAWRRVVTHRERVLPPDHLDLQKARGSVAATIAPLGDLAGSMVLLEKVLEVFTRTLPEDDGNLQHTRMNLAATLRELGDLEGSRDLLERALEVLSRTSPEGDQRALRVRINLSMTSRQLGDLARARALAEKAVEIGARTLPDEAPLLQTARSSLASVLFGSGDFAGARALQERVLEILSGLLPDEHFDVLAARASLALTLKELGDSPGARALEEKVLEVRSRTLPADSPDVQRARLNLAVTVQELGDLSLARDLEETALEALSRTAPPGDPILLAAKQNLSVTLARLGETGRVRGLLEEVLTERSKVLPPEDAQLQLAQENLATYALRLGDEATASDLAQRLAAAATLDSRSSIWAGSPREATEVCFRKQGLLSSLLSMSREFEDPSARAALDRACFAAIESLRAADLSLGAMRSLVRGDSEVESRREAVRIASSELSRRVQEGAAGDEITRAISDRDEAQRRMSAVLTGRVELASLLEESSAKLLERRPGDSSGLVAYWTYERWSLDPGATIETATPSLLAFVAGPERSLVRIELGPVQPIEQAVTAWRDALGVSAGRGVGVGVRSGDSEAAQSAGEAIRRLVFDPLRAALKGARSLVVVGDGVLHLVPLDVLADEEGRLGDHFTIATRLSLREILWRRPSVDANGSLVVVGGAAFDRPPGEEGGDSAGSAPGAPTPSATIASALRGGPWEQGFPALPQTAFEARAIAQLHRRIVEEPARTRLLEGSGASREALETLARGTRWLHVASHGWFAAESALSWDAPRSVDRAVGLLGTSSAERIEGSSPMVLAGLALAGANLGPDAAGRDRGLVTAEEISSWDLSACELAVLSACDTSVGLRRAGQGVASLQKALHMAGARSVITSLWKVPDEATRELMVEFYRRLWVEKEPKHRALWEAKRKLREAVDERGRPKYSTRDWAAWVLSGDPD